MIASISGPIVIRAHVRKRPAGEGRQATTYFIFLYLLGFLAFLTVWIGSIIYVISASKYYKNASRDRYKFDMDECDLREPNTTYVWLFSMINITDVTIVTVANYYHKPISCGLILWYLLAGQFILFSFFILLRYTPKVFVYLGVLGLTLSVGALIYSLVDIMNNWANSCTLDFTIELLRLLLVIAAINGALMVGVNPIAEIVEKAFRAMFTFYSIIIFVMLITLTVVLQLILMVQSLQVTTFNDPLRYTIMFGSVYVFSFIYSYQNMVLSHLIASWHKPSKQTPPTASILLSAAKVSRNHLGSVAYSATYFLPLLQVIYVFLKQRFTAAPRYQNCFIELAAKVYIIITFTTYTEALVAIHGYTYYEAIKKSFYILVKNSSMFMAVVEVFKSILGIGLLITFLIIFLTPVLVLGGSYDVNPFMSYSLTEFVVIFLLVLSVLTPAFMASVSCVTTTLLCALEDEEEAAAAVAAAAAASSSGNNNNASSHHNHHSNENAHHSADEENPPPYEAAVVEGECLRVSSSSNNATSVAN